MNILALVVAAAILAYGILWLLQRRDERIAKRRILEAEAAAAEAWASAHQRIAMDAVVVSRQMREQLGPTLAELGVAIEDFAALWSRSEIDSMRQEVEEGLGEISQTA